MAGDIPSTPGSNFQGVHGGLGEQLQSGASSKRSSPPASYPMTSTNSAAGVKRVRVDDGATGPGTPGAASAPTAVVMDPDQLSDALLSAGVDLKEEENLLSSTLPDSVHGGGESGRYAAAGAPVAAPGGKFLDSKRLQIMLRELAQEAGVKLAPAPFDQAGESDIQNLMSLGAEEWLTDIVTSAIVLSRHRRRSQNTEHSDVARALRALATKDKEVEELRHARRLQMGLENHDGQGSKLGFEEQQQRAANQTAEMMTSGRKKYSWMSSQSSAPSSRPANTRSDGAIKFRDVREEPGIVIRDLLGAMDGRRMGVEKAIMKAYSREKRKVN